MVFSWGLGSYGQLANNKLELKQSIPKRIIISSDQKDENNNLNFEVFNLKKNSGSLKIVLSLEASYLFLSKKWLNTNSL